MDTHASPITCGHSPVDMGRYYADELRNRITQEIGEKNDLFERKMFEIWCDGWQYQVGPDRDEAKK